MSPAPRLTTAVTVVTMATAGDVPAGDEWLAPQERAVAAAFRFEPRRRDWRLGRWVAKQAVAATLGPDAVPAVRIAMLAAPDGAPEALLDGRRLPIVVSITHRSGRAACLTAPAGSGAGCDLELVESRDAAFARDYLGPEELAWTESLPGAMRSLAVTLAWSAKESALKATREGLRADTRSVRVAVDPFPRPAGSEHRVWSPLRVTDRRSRHVFEGWWLTFDAFVLTAVGEALSEEPPELRRVRPEQVRSQEEGG